MNRSLYCHYAVSIDLRRCSGEEVVAGKRCVCLCMYVHAHSCIHRRECRYLLSFLCVHVLKQGTLTPTKVTAVVFIIVFTQTTFHQEHPPYGLILRIRFESIHKVLRTVSLAISKHTVSGNVLSLIII